MDTIEHTDGTAMVSRDEAEREIRAAELRGRDAERKRTEHNGWANVETWMISMFLDGNYTGEGTPASALEVVAEEIEDKDDTSIEKVIQPNLGGVMDRLRTFVEAYTDEDDGSTLRGDLLKVSLDGVDWRELAKHWSANVCELQDAEGEPADVN